jgi:hypothetical protein
MYSAQFTLRPKRQIRDALNWDRGCWMRVGGIDGADVFVALGTPAVMSIGGWNLAVVSGWAVDRVGFTAVLDG